MRFEWDEAKRRSNIRRHGIDFLAARVVFAGRTMTLVDDRFDYEEPRFLTLGFCGAESWGLCIQKPIL